jgi:transposase-like protein
MTKGTTLRQFQDRFPTEEACLDHLFQVRYGDDFHCPKCKRPAKYTRIAKRRAYQCQWCANQVYPTAGTPFDRTRTSLRDWFTVMFMFCTTRNGVAAKRVEREIGVTYKTAWRMCHEIRKYMAQLDSDDPLGGVGETVEIDETLIGGSVSGMESGYKGNKTCVVGMQDRDGELITRVVRSRTKDAMRSVIGRYVLPGTTINTDEFGGYKDLDQCGFQHVRVNHKSGFYADGKGAGVNTLEGYWAMLKRGINGTHIHVSGKHLWKYLGEFEYRWNMRAVPHLMIERLMYSFTR